MAYLVIENFVGGLDTRRHILTSKPGSVVELRNAHVTRGGEVEKRKIFELYKTLPAGTFGLNVCGNKLFTFGSQVLSVPSPIEYRRLQHPDGIFAMTKLVSFTTYNGKPFVIAEFADNSRYAFYDDAIVEDWVTGVFRPSHVNINGFLNYLKTGLTGGYTATVLNNGMTIIGPEGKEFTVSAVANKGLIVGAPVTTSKAVKPIPEVLAKGSFIVAGGSPTPASFWKDGRNMDAASCPGIRSIRVKASSLTDDDGIDLIGWGGATGVRFDTFPPPYTTGSSWGSLLYNIAKAINDNTSTGIAHGYSAYSYRRAQNSGNDTNSMYVYGPGTDGADANGVVVQVEFDGNPSFVGEIGSLVDPGSIAVSPYDPNRFIATMGVLAGGATNAIMEVKVDGVDILGGRVNWKESNSVTAQSIADQINSHTSDPEYTATAIEGGKVLLTAVAGTGSSVNGRTVVTGTVGNVVITSMVPMAGGVNAVGGVSQRTTLPYSGTPVTGSHTTITVTETENAEYPYYFGATRMAGLNPNFCLTHRSKVHVLADTYMLSSGLDNPTKWRISDLGSSFINLSNNVNGSENLVSAAPYQGKLAIFTRDACQVWTIDVDAAQNAQAQIIQNSGCTAPNSVLNWGEVDVFYLSDSGMRSLRARDSSNQAVVNDIGTPIDTDIVAELRAHTDEEVFNSHSIVEPKDGRFMITIGEKLYVLSQFPASGILAWSTYEPGFTIEDMCVCDGRLYVRSSDNKVYLYGGSDNNTYDACTVTVTLPYLNGGKAAHQKTLQGIDITSDGTWEFYAGTDTYRPEVRDLMATITDSSLQLGRVQAYGIGTHIGVKLVSLGSGYHRVANIVVHYELNDAD
jgi:hypothetical protein